MLKRTMLVLSAITLLSTNVSGVALATQHDNNKNHSSYWETANIECQKFDNYKGQIFTTTDNDVVKVVVKGGPDRVVYTSAPFADLTAPINPKNKHSKTYGISHVIVCAGQVESETDNSNEQPETDNNNENQPHSNRIINANKPENKPVRVANNNSHTPVTICHRTHSVKNPYVVITVDDDAVNGLVGHDSHKADHYGVHTGDVFSGPIDYAPNAKNWGDIIPPIDGSHNGLNWDEEGRAIYNNDCQISADQQPDVDGIQVLGLQVLGDAANNADGEILDAVSTTQQVAGVQAPARLANTGLNPLLTFLLPMLTAAPAYAFLRKNRE